MSIITEEFSMLLSSSPENGASNVSSFGNSFDVYLNSPITVPKECFNPRITLVSANVWNSASNISPSFSNDRLRLVLGGVNLDIQFPAGLYSLAAINQQISNGLVQAGFSSTRVQIDGDYATSKTAVWMTVVGDQVDFSQPNSIGSILGWTNQLVTCVVANSYAQYSPNKAQLNRVNSFLISSSLLGGRGIPLNQNSSSIIASIPITAGPNELITYTPQSLTQVRIDHLKGQIVNQFDVVLLDQQRRPVDTNGELFDVLLRFSWEVRV